MSIEIHFPRVETAENVRSDDNFRSYGAVEEGGRVRVYLGAAQEDFVYLHLLSDEVVRDGYLKRFGGWAPGFRGWERGEEPVKCENMYDWLRARCPEFRALFPPR